MNLQNNNDNKMKISTGNLFTRWFSSFLTPFRRSHNLKIFTLNGILFVLTQVFSRTYAPKFLDRLGATSFHYSLFNALPGLVAFLTTISGIIYIEKNKDKRRMMTKFFYISRLFPIILMFTPYLPYEIRGYVFVTLFSLMNLPESIALSSFQSYTAAFFPADERADALSQRNKFMQVFQIIFSIAAGFILSLPENPPAVILIYQSFFLLSAVIGILEIRTMNKLTIVTDDISEKRIELKRSLKKIFRNKEFRIFLVCSLIYHFGWQMGWPLFSYYQIDVLKADEKWLTIINVMSAFFMVISYNFWAEMIRKKGYKLTTAVVCSGMALSPILYALSKTLMINAVMSISMGLFTSGINVVILGSLLEITDREEGLLTVALHATLTNLTLFLSPFFGEFILRNFSVYTALYVSALIRALGALAFFIRYLKTPGDNIPVSERKTAVISE